MATDIAIMAGSWRQGMQRNEKNRNNGFTSEPCNRCINHSKDCIGKFCHWAASAFICHFAVGLCGNWIKAPNYSFDFINKSEENCLNQNTIHLFIFLYKKNAESKCWQFGCDNLYQMCRCQTRNYYEDFPLDSFAALIRNHAIWWQLL